MSRMIRRFEQLMSDARPGQFLAADGNNRPVWVDAPSGGVPQWDGSGWTAPPASAMVAQNAPSSSPAMPSVFTTFSLSNAIYVAPSGSTDIQADTMSNDFAGVVRLPASPANGSLFRITDVMGYANTKSIIVNAFSNRAFSWNGSSATSRSLTHRWESQTWMYCSLSASYLMVSHANTGIAG